MRSILRAGMPICAIAVVSFHAATAAEFYRVASEISYDSVQAVSPDGSMVVTTLHVWTPAGGLVPYLPGNYTYSRDISNNGIVVGLVDGSYVAFRTLVGGPIEELSGNYSDAYGITPDGSVIVGYSTTADGHRAVRWTRETGLVGLGHLAPGNHFSDAAHGVSADGSIVVGEAESAQGQQAFRWTQQTGLVGLGDLPGGDFFSSARGISSDGQVIIGHSTSSAGTEAFRWTQVTGMVGLGDLAEGTFQSNAYATSADGAIVVGSAATANLTAFVWTPAHGMRNLQDVLIAEHGLGAALAGWSLSEASDISDDGNVIVGYGRAPSGNLEGFVVVIPEPSTIWLLIAATVILLAKHLPRIRAIVLASLCLSLALASGQACGATFYRLGRESTTDYPAAVSPDGSTVLVGRYVWTVAGGFVDSLPRVPEVYSADISNGGIVAGMYCGPDTGSCYEAYVAPVGGPVQGLGTLGGDDSTSYSFAITSDGSTVVGYASSPAGIESFRWTQATAMVGLGHLVPNQNSHDTAYDISADGSVIVGQSGDDTVLQAYRWTAATGMVGLGDLPGGAFNSFARVVSADGSVVAGTGTSAAGTEAFRWTQATGMVGLGDLHSEPFASQATAISSDGSAIYGASNAPGINEDAWVWTQAAGMRKFQDVLVSEHGLGAELAGWRLWRVTDVSADGLVLVGAGRNPSGELEGFAVVIPEPSTAALVIAAIVLILIARQRAGRLHRCVLGS